LIFVLKFMIFAVRDEKNNLGIFSKCGCHGQAVFDLPVSSGHHLDTGKLEDSLIRGTRVPIHDTSPYQDSGAVEK